MQRLVRGCVEIQPLNASAILMERVDIAVNTSKMNPGMNVILIEGVVKGYHECPFTLRDMSELTNLEQELITEQDFKTVPSFV